MSFSSLTRREFDTVFGTLGKPTPARRGLISHAAKRVGRDEAEACVQAGLLHTWISIARFDITQFHSKDNIGPLVQFAARYVRAACKDHLRRPVVGGQPVPPEVPHSHDSILLLAEQGELTDLSSHVYAALRDTLSLLLDRVGLTHLQEYCVDLWLDNHTHTQIAEHLQIAQPVVSRHISAAAAKLREAYQRDKDICPGVRHLFHETVRDQNRARYHAPKQVWMSDLTSIDRERRCSVRWLEWQEALQEALEAGRERV